MSITLQISANHRIWDLHHSKAKECARHAAAFGVTIGVQNHHDPAVHYDKLLDMVQEIDEPNCKVMFDAWAPALHGMDPAEGVRRLAPYVVHTTVADYLRRPRFRYQPSLVNYQAGKQEP